MGKQQLFLVLNNPGSLKMGFNNNLSQSLSQRNLKDDVEARGVAGVIPLKPGHPKLKQLAAPFKKSEKEDWLLFILKK